MPYFFGIGGTTSSTGWICSRRGSGNVADTTAGAAAATLIAPDQYVLSAEFNINLLRPAKGSHLSCVAKVLKAGSTLTVVESEVFCGTANESRLVSKATVTLAVLKPRVGK